MSPCLEEVAEPAGWKLRVWTANTDEEKEGVWKDRYSDFAPWPPLMFQLTNIFEIQRCICPGTLAWMLILPLAYCNVLIDKYIG